MSSHETPLAQLNTNRRISQTETWPVHPDELRVTGRETRSSHPEIIYRLGDQQIEYHTPTRVQLPLQPGRIFVDPTRIRRLRASSRAYAY